jgi:hypothetical protein
MDRQPTQENGMEPLKISALIVAAAFLNPGQVRAEDEFHGLVEKRPEGAAGVWIIGGREVAVTERTKLEEDDGPLAVGTCVEVEYQGGSVKEIESEDPAECGPSRTPAPGQPAPR